MTKKIKSKTVKILEDYTHFRESKNFQITDKIFLVNSDLRKYHPKLKSTNKNIKKMLLNKVDWFSITPEKIVEKIIKRVKIGMNNTLSTNNSIICCFSGVGGDAIPFLESGFDVICNEIDYQKVKFLKSNIKECVGKKNVKIIKKSFFEIEKEDLIGKEILMAMVTPPWGGIDYTKNEFFDLKSMKFDEIHEKITSLVENVVYFLPKNCKKKEIEEIVGRCEISMGINCGKSAGLLVYCGVLFH